MSMLTIIGYLVAVAGFVSAVYVVSISSAGGFARNVKYRQAPSE